MVVCDRRTQYQKLQNGGQTQYTIYYDVYK